MAKTFKGRVGWAVVRKLIKAIPFVGPIFAVGFAGYEIKKKGVVPGAVHVGLDVTPVVGTAKNVVEIFTGDWIPDKPSKNSGPQQGSLQSQPHGQLQQHEPQASPANQAQLNPGESNEQKLEGGQ